MTEILVTGTIAPWLWNGNNFYQGPLIDPGLFGPAGWSLTGDSIQVLWQSDPVTATITVNGTSIVLGPATGFYAPYSIISDDYANITVQTFSPFNGLCCNVAIDSFGPNYSYQPPLGIGGSMELIGLDGYYYVSSMVAVPGPVVGEGLIPIALIVLLGLAYMRVGSKWAKKLVTSKVLYIAVVFVLLAGAFTLNHIANSNMPAVTPAKWSSMK